MVGLQHKLASYPLQLSGGEQQRVAIARALVNDPLVLIADEPTGNLDPDLAQEIMALFERINGQGTTVLVATHDRSLIQRMKKRVIGLDHGRMAFDYPAPASMVVPAGKCRSVTMYYSAPRRRPRPVPLVRKARRR